MRREFNDGQNTNRTEGCVIRCHRIAAGMGIWDCANTLKAGQAENQRPTIRTVRAKIVHLKLRKPLKPQSSYTP